MAVGFIFVNEDIEVKVLIYLGNNELIEVILEKSHKFTVGFPFNTRVKTLNH